MLRYSRPYFGVGRFSLKWLNIAFSAPMIWIVEAGLKAIDFVPAKNETNLPRIYGSMIWIELGKYSSVNFYDILSTLKCGVS